MFSIKVDTLKFETKDIELELRNKMDAFGLNVVADAKRNAPVNEGRLRNSISYKLTKDGTEFVVEVVVGVNYAAYLEFGTRAYAAAYVSTLPENWQTFAATFKGGNSGTLDEMINRLTEWVAQKGIVGTYSIKTRARTGGKKAIENQNYTTAYLIALSIIRKGMKEHPFLYPAFNKHRKDLFKK